ncbi:hypothetical protein SmJEL517_g00058 [Synchytrium microbalum]|uniref:ABC transporter domain-containing protein n=1 Tax=Synchytrium microbalum TaxID=1806994 RepID=A0A507C9K8_9FUNG|nr:uncharacterized protein SmJEL517_g00058 [Synchytrium microbalum]TPX38270.1 hypothetical protein SmJEL517_g00058 [Synchytrium microbalum]
MTGRSDDGFHHILNFIDGKFEKPVNGSYFESVNPTTAVASSLLLAPADAQDINLAVAAAKRAFESWSKTTRQYRSTLLSKVADIIESRLMEFAKEESIDQGKPVRLAATVDIPRAIYNFRFFASYILHTSEKSSVLDGVALSVVHRNPAGVAGLISPWNLPLYLLTWKIAPCLAFGCTAVCKPSEFTSATAHMLCSVFNEAGVPAGVVNMVFGEGGSAGTPLVCHPDVPLISFTGGTATGEWIYRAAAPYFKKLSLELGGKNANVVFADCNFEDAVATSVRSSFSNSGQICLCGSRILVEESIYDKFVSALVERTDKLVVGDPKDDRTDLGPVNNSRHLEKIMKYLVMAKEEGGKILTGGERVKVAVPGLENGFFLRPTIITGLPHSSPLFQQEVFGPVVCILPFKTEEEAVSLANDTKYGLSASVWSENAKKARRVAQQLRVGTVWVNCWMVRDLNMPFGGTKASGLGREGGGYKGKRYDKVAPESDADTTPNREKRIPSYKKSMVAFRHLSYTVQVPTLVKGGQKPFVPKVLLDNAYGEFSPGLTTVVGLTKSGKSALLQVLTGQAKGSVEGQLLSNGREVAAADIRKISALVSESSIRSNMATVTVKEAVTMAAMLRMPSNAGLTDMRDKIDSVLELLNLDHLAEKVIGDSASKTGITDGERLRTAVAMEVLANPQILFLDNPTLNLSAEESFELMVALSKLANSGISVVVTTRQMANSFFDLVDNTIVLYEGTTLYAGPPKEMVSFFVGRGFAYKEGVDKGEYLTDILKKQDAPASKLKVEASSWTSSVWLMGAEDGSMASRYRNLITLKKTRARILMHVYAVIPPAAITIIVTSVVTSRNAAVTEGSVSGALGNSTSTETATTSLLTTFGTINSVYTSAVPSNVFEILLPPTGSSSTVLPTADPSTTIASSVGPSIQPSVEPSTSIQSSAVPSSADPSTTVASSAAPSIQPSVDASTTVASSVAPFMQPSVDSSTTISSSAAPSIQPSANPSTTIALSAETSIQPSTDALTTVATSVGPSIQPSIEASTTTAASAAPSIQSSVDPSTTIASSAGPSIPPIVEPSTTIESSAVSSIQPTADPSTTVAASAAPSIQPSVGASTTVASSAESSIQPSADPSTTIDPSAAPSIQSSADAPTTVAPSAASSIQTSVDASTTIDSIAAPSTQPSVDPSTTIDSSAAPSIQSSAEPSTTVAWSAAPSFDPSVAPSTVAQSPDSSAEPSSATTVATIITQSPDTSIVVPSPTTYAPSAVAQSADQSAVLASPTTIIPISVAPSPTPSCLPGLTMCAGTCMASSMREDYM